VIAPPATSTDALSVLICPTPTVTAVTANRQPGRGVQRDSQTVLVVERTQTGDRVAVQPVAISTGTPWTSKISTTKRTMISGFGRYRGRVDCHARGDEEHRNEQPEGRPDRSASPPAVGHPQAALDAA
jgi:hypothetical protein